MSFKKDFVWGSATSSYQVEGAAYDDGKGLSIWDVFCMEKGHIYENHNGDISCDQYYRYKEDIKMMKEAGIQAYRFSISWPRIFPNGTGVINLKGIQYYDKLINELISNGIVPYITLHHWELPYELYKRGGWMNPDIPEYFARYAAVIAEHFSDRVENFFTINEPQCIAGLGYLTGVHAPGLKVGAYEFFNIWHNLLKAHGKAVQALREHAVRPIKIGMAPCSTLYYPETESDADVEAARRAMFHLQNGNLNDCVWNIAMWSDPIFFGKYPKEAMEYFDKYMPEISEDDMKLISSPIDFYGQNIYNAIMIRADKNGNSVEVTRYDGFPKTAIQWPMTPESMYWGPKFIYERYKKPFYITENGMSSHDWISLDGKVHDSSRVDMMHRYLREYKRAADEGVDLSGYFAWSSIDNFEWAYGYSERFGLVFVDYQTQNRIRKDSSYFYQKVIEENGENL